MSHGAKGEEEIWREFAEQPEALAFESERLLAARLHKPIEEMADVDTGDLPPTGREREATVRVRVNQNFFRDRILAQSWFAKELGEAPTNCVYDARPSVPRLSPNGCLRCIVQPTVVISPHGQDFN